MAGTVEQLGRVIFHSAVQLGVGLLVGTLSDALFQKIPVHPTIQSPLDAVLILVEVAGQMLVNASAAAFVFSRLIQLDETSRDPSTGMSLLLALVNSQPAWTAKIQRLGRYVQEKIGFQDPVDGAQALKVAGDRSYSKVLQADTQRGQLGVGVV